MELGKPIKIKPRLDVIHPALNNIDVTIFNYIWEFNKVVNESVSNSISNTIRSAIRKWN